MSHQPAFEHSQNHQTLPTLKGCAALALWSLTALLSVELYDLPPFQILSTTLFFAFIATLMKISLTKSWGLIKQPLTVWIAGILCVLSNQVGYIMAIKMAPPAHVSLIYYLWPVLVIFFASFLPKEKISMSHILGNIIAFTGIYILVNQDESPDTLHWQHFIGYLFALAATISWAGYTLFSRYSQNVPTTHLGVCCGFAAALCFLSHTLSETTVPCTLKESWLLLAMGIGTTGLAFWLWDEGAKSGNLKLLSAISFLSPVASMAFLVLFEKTELSFALVVAALFVTGGSTICARKDKKTSIPVQLRSTQIHHRPQGTGN